MEFDRKKVNPKPSRSRASARRRSKIYNPKLPVSGFTLVELIITIVLMGIVAYLGSNLIAPVMEGYVDTEVKTLLFNEAQYATSRMAIELRNAIPNTIETNGTFIKFAEFSGGGYYLPLQNADNITCTGLMPKKGEEISIYNTKPQDFFKRNRVYKILNVINDNSSFRCILNRNISRDSPYHRVYIIQNIVAFYFDKRLNRIYRSETWQITDDNSTLLNSGIEMASYIKNLRFVYEKGYTYREALVKIEMILEKGGVSLSYNQEIHIRNVP